MRLAEVHYGPDGEMTYPRRRGHAGEEAFPDYLGQARALLAGRPAGLEDGPTGFGPDFEALRWFPLPPACLRQQPAALPADAAGCSAPGPGEAR